MKYQLKLRHKFSPSENFNLLKTGEESVYDVNFSNVTNDAVEVGLGLS